MASSKANNDTTMAALAHLSGLLGFVVPFGNIVAPLLIWLFRKDSEFVADQAKESLNFQISMTIYMIISGILVLILVGFLLMLVLLLVDIVFIIKATIAANNGTKYRYPFTIRLVK